MLQTHLVMYFGSSAFFIQDTICPLKRVLRRNQFTMLDKHVILHYTYVGDSFPHSMSVFLPLPHPTRIHPPSFGLGRIRHPPQSVLSLHPHSLSLFSSPPFHLDSPTKSLSLSLSLGCFVTVSRTGCPKGICA